MLNIGDGKASGIAWELRQAVGWATVGPCRGNTEERTLLELG